MNINNDVSIIQIDNYALRVQYQQSPLYNMKQTYDTTRCKEHNRPTPKSKKEMNIFQTCAIHESRYSSTPGNSSELVKGTGFTLDE